MDKQLSSNDVLRLVEALEKKIEPNIHPMIGVEVEIIEQDEVQSAVDVHYGQRNTPEIPPPPPRLKNYCDHCGYVDMHARDCPELAAEQLEVQVRRDEALERAERLDAERDEPILPLLRRAGASLLRKLARRIAG